MENRIDGVNRSVEILSKSNPSAAAKSAAGNLANGEGRPGEGGAAAVSLRFEALLRDFLESEVFGELAIGELIAASPVRQFERHFSVQRIVALEGSRSGCRIYLKLFKNAYGKKEADFLQAIQRDYETARFWHEKLKEFPEFETIRPLYFSLPHRGMVTAEAAGTNLGELVCRELRGFPGTKTRRRLQAHMARAGRLLHTIQSLPAPSEPYSLDTLIEDIDLRMRQFVADPRSGFSSLLRQQVLRFFEDNRAAAEADELRITYLHRDFMMGNLLVNGEKIVVHDFGRVSVGPHWHDLTRFYHHLELLKYKPVYRPRYVSELQTAFLRGYGLESGPARPAFRFFLLRHYITHYKGLWKNRKGPWKSQMYDRWVMRRHLRNIARIVSV